MYGGDENCIQSFGVGTLTTTRHRWDSITMEHKETDWENMDWPHIAQYMSKWRAVVKM
jgi:hypothetical protein